MVFLQAARWSSERKALQAQEADEDAKLEEDKKEEIAARAEMERKRAIRQAEAQAPGRKRGGGPATVIGCVGGPEAQIQGGQKRAGQQP